jgi:ABC-type antimicrobial peptide transport system permease subunit
MVIHLLKLIRSRLGGSCWILVELLVVFVILWFMMYYFVAQGMLTRMPVGFKLDHVYNVTLAIRPSDSPSFIAYEEGSEEPVRNIERIVERIERHPDVEVVGLSYYSLPYTDSNIGSRVLKDSINQRVRAMILSADLASKLYGHTDVIGAEIYNYNDTVPCHVIAVTEPVRNSEYDSRNQHSVFSPLDLRGMFGKGQLDEKGLTRVQITFRTRPEVSTSNYAAKFRKEMSRSLMVGNYWVSEVRDYEGIRAFYLENSERTSAHRLVSAMGLFFLVNVFLAVIGTFWFHVSRRRSELGLRMAMGSTRKGIEGLMIGEGLLLLAIASVPGLLICLNLAVADIVPCGVIRFTAISLLTGGVLAFVVFLAIWYPARKAARQEPADALRYDG